VSEGFYLSKWNITALWLFCLTLLSPAFLLDHAPRSSQFLFGVRTIADAIWGKYAWNNWTRNRKTPDRTVGLETREKPCTDLGIVTAVVQVQPVGCKWCCDKWKHARRIAYACFDAFVVHDVSSLGTTDDQAAGESFSVGFIFLCPVVLRRCPRKANRLGWAVLTPSTPAVPNDCCSNGPAPYWSNPPFLPRDAMLARY